MISGERFGSGQGSTKKAAKNEAAKEGLKKMGVVVPQMLMSKTYQHISFKRELDALRISDWSSRSGVKRLCMGQYSRLFRGQLRRGFLFFGG